MSSYDDFTEKVLQNNLDVKIETITRNPKKKLLDGKKGNHVSFFVDNIDYIDDKSKKKVICHKCTDTFFNIFFKDVKDENDEFMDEIFKMKVYMYYVPDEELFRCTNNPEHIEVLREPLIQDQPKKKIIGAGMENYPEYVSYLDPDSVSGSFILTANSTNKKSKNRRPFFKEETEDEIWNRFVNSKHS